MWTVTTPVLAPEIYAYHFVVDGQTMLDPRNTDARRNLLELTDNLTIPGTPPEPWEIQSIPHGVVEHHFYTSQVVLVLPNNQSQYYVYLPPGYNPKGKEKYPVLYLLHGYSDDADAWTTVGKANFILDSLIASGKAKPMIVVMTLGYGNMQVITGPRSPELNQQNYDLYQKALLTEVIPQIESNYHVSAKREDRAIAGLSMGGPRKPVHRPCPPGTLCLDRNFFGRPSPRGGCRPAPGERANREPEIVVDGLRCRRRPVQTKPGDDCHP